MSAMGDLLDGAVREDASRLETGSFADDRFGTVRGRIARRRAARSAGVGGASVLGVGVLAVGGSQVLGEGSGVWGSASLATAVCTTSTADVATTGIENIPADAVFAVIDKHSGDVAFVGWVDDEPRAWSETGSPWRMSQVDGHAELVFESGTVVRLNPDDAQDHSVMHSANITVMPIAEYVDSQNPQDEATAGVTDLAYTAVDGTNGSRTWTVIRKSDGTPLVSVTRQGDGITASGYVSAGSYLLPSEDGSLLVSLEDGRTLSVEIDGDALNLSYLGATADDAVPVVTCVTITPEPSTSASPTATISSSATPSASPAVTPSDNVATVASPFYCGTEIVSEESEAYDFRISQVTWEPAEEVNAMLDEWAELTEADYWDRAQGADVLKVTLLTNRQPQGGLSGAGGTSPLDPRDLLAVNFIDTTADGAAFARGLGFVAVRDGVVVGVLPGENQHADGHVYEDGNDPNPSAYFITPDDAFEACPGVELGDDWDLYAVGGQIYAYSDGTTEEPLYAWMKIEPQN